MFVSLTLSKDRPRSGEMKVKRERQTAFQKPSITVRGVAFSVALFFYLPTFLDGFRRKHLSNSYSIFPVSWN